MIEQNALTFFIAMSAAFIPIAALQVYVLVLIFHKLARTPIADNDIIIRRYHIVVPIGGALIWASVSAEGGPYEGFWVAAGWCGMVLLACAATLTFRESIALRYGHSETRDTAAMVWSGMSVMVAAALAVGMHFSN
ncbi:MAG: hypothetical protein AAF714_01315 [Pseudomonadota bacterium]